MWTINDGAACKKSVTAGFQKTMMTINVGPAKRLTLGPHGTPSE